VTGFAESEIKQFSKSLSAFKQNLAIFEKHLKLRNYLVGYQLTLADVYLIVCLMAPYELLIDKRTRDQTFPNLTRFMVLNLKSFHFQKAFGKVQFCIKAINPVFDLKIEKKPAADKPADKKDAGKKDDGKKDAGKKDAGKKDAGKKDAGKKEAQKKEAAPKAAPEAKKDWESSLSPIKFDFYDYKTLFVNAPSQKEALEKLWGPDMWDDKGVAFWLIQY
jgi:hypothetical protein